MTKIDRWRGVAPWLLLVLVGCSLSALSGDRSRSHVTPQRATPQRATFQGGYAAMAEVPVSGGELRLVAPQVIEAPVAEQVSGGAAPGASDEPMGATGDDVSAGREVIAFPLRHTAVTVKVAGMVGVYEIEQEFANPFSSPLEAVYVFPLGDDAAVSGYQMTIGDRVIRGQIKTRSEARQTYEQARAAGYTTALVEQQKPNIFTQHIANIAPRETVRVKITYTELLDYQDGTYELAVPLTVGPRFLPTDRAGQTPVAARAASTPPTAGALSIPYADATVAASTVSFTAELDAGVPIGEVKSPSHSLLIEATSPTRRRVTLQGQGELPNRDLVIHYATASATTTAGVLAHRVTDDGYFLLTVQPKASYRTGDISSREVMLVLDTSGSMSGQPLAQAKTVASAIVQSLGERDTFNVMQFASGVSAMGPASIPGDLQGRQRGLDFLARLAAGGGTQMDLGVAAMLAEEPGPGQVRIIYFLTDGYIGNDDVVVSAARRLAGHNRIMTVGIGAAPNRYLLDRLAAAGRGFSTYVSLNESVSEVTKDLVLRSAYPYLTDVTVDFGDLQVAEVSPGPIPDVYAGQPLVLSGRYRTPGSGLVTISAYSGGHQVKIPMQVTLPEQQALAPVAQLWARRKIEDLMRDADPNRGMDAPAREQLTELGLAFSLVTQETSFVAVDHMRVVDGAGQARLVEQPALLPEGTWGQALAATSPEVASSGTSYSSSSSGSSGAGSSGSGSSSYRDNDYGGSWGAGATAAPGGGRWGWAAAAVLLGLLAFRRRKA